MLGYLSLIIGFIATLCGVLGKTRNENMSFPKNITTFGWIAIILAIISMSASVFIKRNSEIERDRFRYWAMRELENATYQLLSPYVLVADMPEGINRFNRTKILRRAGIFSFFSKIDIRDTCIELQKPFGCISTEKTKEALDNMSDILSRYSIYLSPETIELITKIRVDTWTEIMLSAKEREMRIHGKKRTEMSQYLKSFFENSISNFAAIVEELEDYIGIQIKRLSKELNIAESPPIMVFLK